MHETSPLAIRRHEDPAARRLLAALKALAKAQPNQVPVLVLDAGVVVMLHADAVFTRMPYKILLAFLLAPFAQGG